MSASAPASGGAPTVSGGGHQRTRTATFVPYYWEAYNEIVEPRRFDHYLVRKWLPDLGSLAFTLVKVLRDRCYHNPETGVLRDCCELSLDDLAAAVGVSRRTLTRELADNLALGQFVQRVRQYQLVGARVHQDANQWRVSMDDPIHPTDMERYDTLRAERERERDLPRPTKVVNRKPPKEPVLQQEGQNDPHRNSTGSYEGQNDLHKAGQFDLHNEGQIGPPYEGHFDPPNRKDLPFGELLTKESLTPPADPPIHSPRGEGEAETDARSTVWAGVQKRLEAQAQAGEISIPSYHAHLTHLRLASLTETSCPEGIRLLASVAAPSTFTREWVEKRHGDRLCAALAAVLERNPETVIVEIRGPQK